ncbi:glycosyltransferase family 2 protein [Sagittula sp. M10.9X]|uniref:Glycosyltransferase family 2 protein n=2 Tax=Sagittula salina TaxID=2820268 RepID=A0A940MS04_9RHOB|nr:glycosyltransferase family 2 protein [Sagittula salina]
MTLRSVRAALRAMEGLDAELVVVDNDSGDGSFERITQAVADEGLPVRVIQSGWNGGFGAGNNVGIRAGMADGTLPDLVYLLNSDAFPEPDAIRVLSEFLAAHPSAGIAGSRIVGEDGAPHWTAFRFPSAASELEGSARFGPLTRLLTNHKVPLGVPEAPRRVDWLAGASMMIRREVLDRVGLFDEVYFLYFEETDLCRRAAQAGFETHYVPQSRAMHIGSASTGMGRWARVPGFWLDSRWHYFTKHHGRARAMLATGAHLLGGMLWRVRCALQRRARMDPPHFLRDLVIHDLKAMLRPLPGRDAPQRRDDDVHV